METPPSTAPELAAGIPSEEVSRRYVADGSPQIPGTFTRAHQQSLLPQRIRPTREAFSLTRPLSSGASSPRARPTGNCGSRRKRANRSANTIT